MVSSSLGLQLWPPYNFSSSYAPATHNLQCKNIRTKHVKFSTSYNFKWPGSRLVASWQYCLQNQCPLRIQAIRIVEHLCMVTLALVTSLENCVTRNVHIADLHKHHLRLNIAVHDHEHQAYMHADLHECTGSV